MDIKINQLQQLTQMEAPKQTQTSGEDFKFTLISNIKEDKLQEKLSSLMKEIEEQIIARRDELNAEQPKKAKKGKKDGSTAAPDSDDYIDEAISDDILADIEDDFEEFTPADE